MAPNLPSLSVVPQCAQLIICQRAVARGFFGALPLHPFDDRAHVILVAAGIPVRHAPDYGERIVGLACAVIIFDAIQKLGDI